MTDRIKTTAETNTTHVFYALATSELELEPTQLLTADRIVAVTYQRYIQANTLLGNGTTMTPLDEEPIFLEEDESVLFDEVQEGLPYSTQDEQYTWLWRVPETRMPFFPKKGIYYVEMRFLTEDESEPNELITYEVTVT